MLEEGIYTSDAVKKRFDCGLECRVSCPSLPRSTHARFRCGLEENGIDGLDARASTVILVISEEISGGSQGAVRDGGGGGRAQSRWAPQASTKDSDGDDGPKELVRTSKADRMDSEGCLILASSG